MKLAKMTEQHAIEISTWQYTGDCRIYNLPPWPEMVAGGRALADAGKREREFRALLAEDGTLLAYTRYSAKPEGIMLGVGANPAHLSMGCGAEATRLTVELVKARHPGEEIFLDVRVWNSRAVRSYQKAGFVIEKTFEQETPAGSGEFYRMYYRGE